MDPITWLFTLFLVGVALTALLLVLAAWRGYAQQSGTSAATAALANRRSRRDRNRPLREPEFVCPRCATRIPVASVPELADEVRCPDCGT